MEKKYILALDAGTTSSRAILFDRGGQIAGTSQKEFRQIYPKPGWVEHDPLEIAETQIGAARQVLLDGGVTPGEVAAIGITNQRETTVVWNKNTGKPVYNAIVWQDRRTASICEALKEQGLTEVIREKTGLIPDSYFSATKIKWILDNIDGARGLAEKGELLFGTIDTYLVWNLTGGRVHVTDYSNAARTMLFNIVSLEWDKELISILSIPPAILPEVKPSGFIYGYADENAFVGGSIPIAGIAGDQQAALFGQACFESGAAKNTYGTGSFILMNTGDKPTSSSHGLLTTIAWGLGNKVEYALEGSVFITGAAVQWLRDELKAVDDARDSEYFAEKVKDTGGVYMVPAFAGLGAPYWDMYARGAILGMTRGTNLNHIIRATLESISYQVRDVLDCMEQDSGIKLTELKVDGGACANNFLMQFQADILGVPVVRPRTIETTAKGAAFLAGLTVGFWQDKNDIVASNAIDRIFVPAMEEKKREKLYSGWLRAVERAKGWEVD